MCLLHMLNPVVYFRSITAIFWQVILWLHVSKLKGYSLAHRGSDILHICVQAWLVPGHIQIDVMLKQVKRSLWVMFLSAINLEVTTI